jgi:hypothetical protein
MFRLSPDKNPQRSNPRRPARAYRNPITLAQEWQQALNSGQYSTQADFARKQGISRARVTQVFRLLNLAPEALNAIVALGDPLPSRILTERRLRSVINLSAEEQVHRIKTILSNQR